MLLLSLSLSLSGCMQQAVLENDVRSAQWKARTLATATDVNIAQAALSAQLVELEALYQRTPDDARVLGLLDRGYRLMAQGFIELRRLDAVNARDPARAEQEAQRRSDAEARARYYRQKLPTSAQISRFQAAKRARGSRSRLRQARSRCLRAAAERAAQRA